MSLIKCNNINFEYDGKPILKDVSFEINKGDYICVIGENGAGKSTLLNIIAGILKPNSGYVEFVDNLTSQNIGYLPQYTEIPQNFPASVYEIVISGCVNKLKKAPFYTRKEKQIVNYNINLLEISNIKNKSFHELSGGQKQRVLLARALCSGENTLLLDEPVSGLDPLVTDAFYKIINHLNYDHGTTIVMVSHDIKNTLKYATHIIYLEKNFFYFGTKDNFLNSKYKNKIIGGNNND